jgi:hypothetical protein
MNGLAFSRSSWARRFEVARLEECRETLLSFPSRLIILLLLLRSNYNERAPTRGSSRNGVVRLERPDFGRISTHSEDLELRSGTRKTVTPFLLHRIPKIIHVGVISHLNFVR